MTVLLANNVSSALAASITASATSMTVTDGSRFPVLSAGQYFYATIIATNGIVEIVKVNTRNGNAMSIIRAQDGTNAQAFPSGARVEMRINAASVRDTVTDQTGPLDTRLTTAEGDITALEGRMTTAEGDITSLEGRMTTAESDIVALENFDTTLGTSAGSNSVGFLQAGTGAMARTVQGKLRETLSVIDFGADPTGVADSTSAVQAAFTAANGSKTVFFPDGSYRITSPVDCKASSFFGQSMYGSIVLCHVSNARTLTNTGRSISNLTFNGDGFATADALEIDGYLTNINQCYFYKVRDAICPIAIIVTSTVNQCLFLTCNSAINDKLHDGTSAHTTLWFTSNSVQYGTHAFVMKTQAAGMYFSGNVFEQLDYVYYSFGQQLFNDVWIKNWFEQISSNLTIFYNTFSGGTSVKIENDVRPGGYTITDAAKMAPTQFATTGTSGNAGGVIIGNTGIRVSTFNTEAGYIFDAYGIKTAALTATFTTTNDFTISTMSGNGTQANRGGDIVADLGVGTFAQRNGCIRSSADNTYSIGSTDFRWANAYVTQLRPGAGTVIWTSGAGSPEGVVTAPVGSLFTRTDGGAGTTLYVKQSGTGNTGWAAK